MNPAFYKPSEYNRDTKNQLWMSAINDTHDAFCGCCKPFAHILYNLFPEGHQDLDLTIRQILKRESENPPWHFGGQEEESGGGEAGAADTTKEDTSPKQKQGDIEEKEDIENLLAAFQDAERR